MLNGRGAAGLRWCWALLLAALSGTMGADPVQSQEVQTVSEAQLLRFLRGDVLMLGSAFPGAVFQQGVLHQLRAGTIRIRLVTGRANRTAFLPLIRAGGELRVLPGALEGGLVVTPSAVLIPSGGTWKLVLDPQVVQAVKSWALTAWNAATSVTP